MNVLLRLSFLCTYLIFQSSTLRAQEKEANHSSLIAYPIVFFLPETGIGGGFASAFNFYCNKKDTLSPPSQLQLGASYTQNRQVSAYLPFHFYWNQRKNDLNGQLEFNRFPYYFYGTSTAPLELREKYIPTSYLFRINYLRKIRNHIFIGPRYWFRDMHIAPLEESHALYKPLYTGHNGGNTSGIGGVLLYDTRDNVYNSAFGSFLEISGLWHSRLTGSNFSFNRYRLDLRHFKSVSKRGVLAIQLFLDATQGTTPFFELPSIGSSSRMRGYLQNTVIDQQLILSQLEYRQNIWNRWGCAIFGSVSHLDQSITNTAIKNSLWSGGFGLRYMYDKEKRMNIRLDYGLGKNTSGLYLTIGESF